MNKNKINEIVPCPNIEILINECVHLSTKWIWIRIYSCVYAWWIDFVLNLNVIEMFTYLNIIKGLFKKNEEKYVCSARLYFNSITGKKNWETELNDDRI